MTRALCIAYLKCLTYLELSDIFEIVQLTCTVFLPGVELSPCASRLSAKNDWMRAPANDSRLQADSTSLLKRINITLSVYAYLE